jgi:hypothetical protein
MLCIWATIGIDNLVGLTSMLVKKNTFYPIVSGTISIVVFFSMVYAGSYLSWSLAEQGSWHPQIQQVVAQTKHKKDPVAWVDLEGYTYILVAWYSQMSAQEFAATVRHQQANTFGFYYGEQVGGYHFVAQKSDQSNKEKTVVMWDDEKSQWQVETR